MRTKQSPANGAQSYTRTITNVETQGIAQLSRAALNAVFVGDADPMPPIEPTPAGLVILPVSPAKGDRVETIRTGTTPIEVRPGAGGNLAGGLVSSVTMNSASGGDAYGWIAENESEQVTVDADVPAIGDGGRGRGLLLANDDGAGRAQDYLRYQGATLQPASTRLALEFSFIPDADSATLLANFPYLFSGDAGGPWFEAWFRPTGQIELAGSTIGGDQVTGGAIEWSANDRVVVRFAVGGGLATVVEYSINGADFVDLNDGAIGVLVVAAGVSADAAIATSPSVGDPWTLTGWLQTLRAYDDTFESAPTYEAELSTLDLSTTTNGAALIAALAAYGLTLTRASSVTFQTVPVAWRIDSSFSFGGGGGGGGSTSAAWIGGLREGGVDVSGGPYDVEFNVGPADGNFLAWSAGPPTSTGFDVLRAEGVFARVGVTGYLGEGGDGGEKVTIALVDSSNNVVDSCTTDIGTAATSGGQQSACFAIDRIMNIPAGTGYKVRITPSTSTQYALGRVELSIVSIGTYTVE